MKKILVAAVCLVSLFLGKKLVAQTYTLRQVLDSIDVRNPGLQQFTLKTKSSYAMGEAAQAWMAPMAGVGISEFPYGSAAVMNKGPMPRQMIMLRLQQMFPNFSRQAAERKYYRSFAKQNKTDRATLQNRLFAEAKRAYYAAFIAGKKLAVLNEQEKQLQLLIAIAKRHLAYGQASLPDIYKTRARLGDLQSRRIQLESISAQSTAVLNSLMNRRFNAPLSIDTSLDLYPEPAKPAADRPVNILAVDSAYVLANRSDIAHLTDVLHTMTLKQQMMEKSAKPVFGITWDNMRMPGFKQQGMYSFSVMAMVSIPLVPWFSKGYQSRIDAVDYQIQAMQKSRESQVLKALGNIHKEWLSLQSAKRNLQLFKSTVIPAYKKTFEASLNALSENTGDLYETLMAWNDLTLKRMAYYDKLEAMLDKRILLEAAMQDNAR